MPAPKWRKLLDNFITNLRIVSREETSKPGEAGTKLKMWNSQRRILAEVAKGMDEGVRKFYVLKSRQLGSTTIWVIIALFWLALHPKMKGALVVDQEKTRDDFREQIRNIITSIPLGYFGGAFGIKKGGDNKYFMAFTNGSQLNFLVAGTSGSKTAWGESSGYSLVLLCVARNTPVVISDGRVKPVQEIQPGDYVLTHTGARAEVVAVVGQPNTIPMMKITPWYGHAITCTPQHKIPTRRGLVHAGDLRHDDWLVMPVRPIVNGVLGTILPPTVKHTGDHFMDDRGRFAKSGILRSAASWETVPGAAAGANIRYTEEFGFAMGYYLSEGHIPLQSKTRRPTGIVFARHREERHYAARALAALKELCSGSVTERDRDDCLTSTEAIYGSPLATWVAEKFGRGDEKIIPDEVFSWGADFCRGLLCGVLAGDGSKTLMNVGGKPYSAMVLRATRASIALQCRDIAMSLGYGWGSLDNDPAGDRYGRNCKEVWSVRWAGDAASGLRDLIGLPSPKTRSNGNSKCVVENGMAFFQIRSLEYGFEESERWDISVDHPDHTFRTPYMAIGNTEVANYGSPEGLNNFEEAMSEDNEERLYVYESTAKGFNHWRDRWMSARADPFRSRCIFVGWWSKELNQIKKNDPLFAMHGLAPPDDREREKIKIVQERYDHEITMEQLAWYRYRQARPSQSEESLNQNQPWYEEEAFVLGGKSYFQTRLIAQDYERIGSVIYVGFRFWFGRDFWSTRMENLAGDPLRKHEVELRVWHPPVKDGRYVIGVDPALGSNEKNDRHCCSVWRCYADKLVQVAEYADNMSETRQCAWVLAYLAGIYRQCVVIIELTGGYGNAVKVELNHLRELLFADFNRDKRSAKGEDWTEFLSNARSYLYRRTDSPGSAGHTEDFMTTSSLKGQIFNEFRDAHINGYAEINSKPLLEEMQIVVQNGDEIAAPGNQKDDRTFAACLATHAWVQHERPGLVMLGETYAAVEARESGEGGTGGLVDQIVSQYLAQVNAAEAEKTPAQTWMEQRGLA